METEIIKDNKAYKEDNIKDISSLRTVSMIPSDLQRLLDVYYFLKCGV